MKKRGNKIERIIKKKNIVYWIGIPSNYPEEKKKEIIKEAKNFILKKINRQGVKYDT